MQAEETATAVAVPAATRTSFLVVDQDPEFRRAHLRAPPASGHVALTAATGEEALLMAREHRPLVVLIETHLPGLNGYEVCRALRDEYGRGIAIAFVSGSRTEVADVSAGLIVGADDYLAKPCDPGELMARAGALLRRVRPDTPPEAPPEAPRPSGGLTRRELEILALLAQGLNQREIAADLSISSSTRRSPHRARAREARRAQPHPGCRGRVPAGPARTRRRRPIPLRLETSTRRRPWPGRRSISEREAEMAHSSALSPRTLVPVLATTALVCVVFAWLLVPVASAAVFPRERMGVGSERTTGGGIVEGVRFTPHSALVVWNRKYNALTLYLLPQRGVDMLQAEARGCQAGTADPGQHSERQKGEGQQAHDRARRLPPDPA